MVSFEPDGGEGIGIGKIACVVAGPTIVVRGGGAVGTVGVGLGAGAGAPALPPWH